MSDAVVVGAGVNGLVAANLVADAGWSVVVLEQQPTPGGAVLADVAASRLYGGLVGWEHLPARTRRGMTRLAWDPATVKVDWALSAPVRGTRRRRSRPAACTCATRSTS